jgi:hypothetical protein
MVLMFLGGALLVGATVLDIFFRIRLYRVGNKRALAESGTFDFRQYHQVRAQHGWAAWPVYLMWAMYVVGIGFLVVAGAAIHFGSPRKSP